MVESFQPGGHQDSVFAIQRNDVGDGAERDKVEIIANKLAQTSLRLPKNMRPKNAELVATLTPHEMEAVQTISQEIYRAEAALVQAWWGPGAGVRLDDGISS